MGTLDGKTALVTGGSRGIGRGIAERLGRDGARVAVHYGANETAAKETVAAIEAAGGSAFTVGQELGVPGDAAALWEAFDRQADGLDILVNNAGIGYPIPFGEVSEEAYDRFFAVNAKAPFFVTQLGLSWLRDGGRVVNISSGLARAAVMPETLTYAMTKGALDVFTRNLSKVLGPRGITVNSVAPGVIDTDINASWLRASDEARAATAASSPLGRVGEPSDIADVVAFLASDDGRWITGQWLDATGGALQ
ncbi:SDR family oxidoreductase [Streptomyces sp. WM6378]|uniref:SDR family oxidoreductase n=1 Tax=Streptomyces sp. WM6378 TaxID=1415557 RepID=UPI0006AF7C46|nr:SDR family oxidoreductase [Streptomyces sp. WM6378]KOU35757.1 short-chain dehydrogenase [Streptomyces sp. WM6378]